MLQVAEVDPIVRLSEELFYSRRAGDRLPPVLSLGGLLGLRQPARFAVTNQTLLWRQVTRSAPAARSTGRALSLRRELEVNDVNGRELYRRG